MRFGTAEGAISFYSQGEFTDLCRGPHVPSTGKLGAFAPRIDGRVFALASAHGLLFVGGAFSSVNGHARHNLAAFSLRTGRLSHKVRDLHIRGAVEALAATRRAVYVGGSFSSVGGRRRAKLAKLTASGGRYRVALTGQGAGVSTRTEGAGIIRDGRFTGYMTSRETAACHDALYGEGHR